MASGLILQSNWMRKLSKTLRIFSPSNGTMNTAKDTARPSFQSIPRTAWVMTPSPYAQSNYLQIKNPSLWKFPR